MKRPLIKNSHLQNRQKALGGELQSVHDSVNRQSQSLAQRERSWLGQLFVDRGLKSIIESAKKEELQNFQAERTRLYKLAVETKFKATHDMCLRWVRESALENQEGFASRVVELLESLSKTIEDATESMIQQAIREFERCEKLDAKGGHYATLAGDLLDSARNRQVKFLNWLDGCLDEFQAKCEMELNGDDNPQGGSPSSAFNPDNWS